MSLNQDSLYVRFLARKTRMETGEIEGGNPERNSDEKFLRTP